MTAVSTPVSLGAKPMVGQIQPGMGDNRPLQPYLTVLAKPIGRCNLNCVFCYQNMNDMLRGTKMPADIQAKLVERVCEFPAQTLNLQWIGGESMAAGIDFYARCDELVQQHQRPGTRVNCPIQTNGTLINDDWIEFLQNHRRFPLSISFEVFKHLQNSLREGKGRFKDSYTIVAKNLRDLRDAGLSFGILSVIELETLDIPPREWIEACVDAGIRQIGMQMSYAQLYTGDLNKVQRYVNWIDELFIEQADYNNTCAPQDRLKIRESYYLYNMIRHPEIRYGCCHHSPQICSDFMLSIDDVGRAFGHCDAFMGTCDEDGNDYLLGTIDDYSLADLIASPRMQQIKNDLAAGRAKCEECSYFELCQGGCGFFKKMNAGSIDAGFGDPIESYCAIKIGLLSYVVDAQRAQTIVRCYENLHDEPELHGYRIDTDPLIDQELDLSLTPTCGVL